MVDETDAPGKRREATHCGEREDKGDGRGRPKNRPHSARTSLDNRVVLRAWHLQGERAPARPDSNGWQERRRPRRPALSTHAPTLSSV